MKKLLLTIPALALYVAAQAQNVGIGTTAPDASAMLEIRAGNKGLLIPRLALTSITDATTVPTPATGLMVYNTNTAIASGTGFYVNTGTSAAPQWAKMPTVYSNNAPVSGQSLVWNGSTYAPAYGTVTVNTDNLSGNGSPTSPITFNGVATSTATSTVLSGNGTNTSPLTVNTATPVYNANKIYNNAVSSTAPTANQVLVWDATNNTYKPAPVNAVQIQGGNVSTTAPTANQVLVWDATNNVYKPAPVNAAQIQNVDVSNTTPTSNQTLVFNSTTNKWEPKTVTDTWGTQTIVNTAGSVLSGNGTTASPLNVNTGSPVYNANKINNISVVGTPTNGQALVYNSSSNTYTPANLSFNYSTRSTGGFNITQGAETGATPYAQNSVPGGSIQPGSGSWTAIPGLSKTFTITDGNNSVAFMTEGVVEYNGTLSSSGWVSYSIAIFVDGKLQATRIFTMTGTGGVDQFDTYQVSGQIEDMSAGSHTITVYGTRRNSPSNTGSNQELYFCSPAPNYPNTNDFMTRGVLFINGNY